eukprot:SAG11_NODE_16459_length_546_cov_3.610738_2_plen_34_part_01
MLLGYKKYWRIFGRANFFQVPTEVLRLLSTAEVL